MFQREHPRRRPMRRRRPQQWRGSQVVRPGSAKPLFVGSIPTRTSNPPHSLKTSIKAVATVRQNYFSHLVIFNDHIRTVGLPYLDISRDINQLLILNHSQDLTVVCGFTFISSHTPNTHDVASMKMSPSVHRWHL